MKKLLGLVLVAASLLVATAEAHHGGPHHGRRWYRPDYDRIRAGRSDRLGTVRIGDYSQNETSDVIFINNRPAYQCNLTHIRLFALSDAVRVTRIEVTYRHARDGRYVDVIDLTDGDDYIRDPRYRRPGRGIYIPEGQDTHWLDLDDVQDGYPSGRCVDSIRVYGYAAHAYRPVNLLVEGLLIDRVPPPHRDPRYDPVPPRHDPYPRHPRNPRYPRNPDCRRDPRYC